METFFGERNMKKMHFRPSPTALLNPCLDIIFKKLFTDDSPQGNRALQSFLEAILGKSVSQIVLQPNELPIENVNDKNVRFDLNCKIDDKEFVNIEMQGINSEFAFEKRAEYYCAHLLNHHVVKGAEWKDIPKVYQISVLNFIVQKNSYKELFHYKFQTDEGFTLHERQNIIFIELPKVKILVEQIKQGILTEEDLTPAQKWSIFILFASKENYNHLIEKISNSEDGIMCAVKVLEKISQDEVIWKQQFDELIIENDRLSLLGVARDKMEQGYRDGMKKGLEQGLEKGIAQGIEQGIEQGIAKNKREIAANLILIGMSCEQIASVTNLSIEEIQQLKNNQ